VNWQLLRRALLKVKAAANRLRLWPTNSGEAERLSDDASPNPFLELLAG